MKKLSTILACLLLTSACVNAQLSRFQYSTEKMGSPFNLIFAATDKATADKLSKECLLLVDSLVSIFSDYDSASELNWINLHAGISPVHISSQMLDLLLIAKKAYFESNGAFNIAIGPLSILWRKARKLKKIPTSDEISVTKKIVNFSLVEVDSAKQTVFLPLKGMRLDFGGLGKGYIAQVVSNYLITKGINQSMIDAGGKIIMSKPINPNDSWKIGINLSESKTAILNQKLHLQNCAVATSGDIYQFMYFKNRKYSHIINPQTGYGLNTLRNVTVIAKDGTQADWLSTACSILSIKQCLQLVASNNGEILIAEQKRTGVIYYKSKGFDELLK